MDTKRSFHKLLRESREEAEQTLEVMAVLLNMSVEEYEALENWSYPDDETLRRLCLLNEWNYYDTQRLIINEMISPARVSRKSGSAVTGEPSPQPASAASKVMAATNANTLGDRLRDVRMVTGQSMEIIAMLLGISPEEYQHLEDGAVPPDDMLRRISMIYNWNYQDLQSVLRSQNAKSFQPSRVGMPFLGNSAAAARLRGVLRELEGLFLHINDQEQNFLLAQLELIRDTMRKNKPEPATAVASAPPPPADTQSTKQPPKRERPQPPAPEKPSAKSPQPAALEDPTIQTSRALV